MNRGFGFLLSGLILTGTMFGQSSGSREGGQRVMLSGRVYDAKGSVVMGSAVLARSREGKEFEAITNDEGTYRIELPAGVYEIEANANGFCPRRVDLALAPKVIVGKNRTFLVPNREQEQKSLDFVFEVPLRATPGTIGPARCRQRTMIRKDPFRKGPEVLRSIAE